MSYPNGVRTHPGSSFPKANSSRLPQSAAERVDLQTRRTLAEAKWADLVRLRGGMGRACPLFVESSRSNKGRRPLVLVVEDEPEAAELLESILRREGCEVLHARDGAQALEMARELPAPDLVLLDLELPIMDGRRLLDSLRSDPSTSGIPVVVMSAAPDATSVRATDNVKKSRLLDGLARVLRRLGSTTADTLENERRAS